MVSISAPAPIPVPFGEERWHTVDADSVASRIGGTSEAADVMTEISHLLPNMQASELQTAAAREVLQAFQLCEQKARICVNLVVTALAAPHAGEDVVFDALWALQKLTSKFSATVDWILEIQGETQVLKAVEKYPANTDLVMCGMWVIHSLRGVRGLAALLDRSSRCSAGLSDQVVAGAIWVVHSVWKQERAGEAFDTQDALHIMHLVVAQLRERNHSPNVQEACCAALNSMIDEEPGFAHSFVEAGATPYLVQSLAMATAEQQREAEFATDLNENLIHNCAGIFSKLAHSSAEIKVAICHGSTLQALRQLGSRGHGGNAEETAVVVLGQLCGLRAVSEATFQGMSAQQALPSVVRGGLVSITELVSNPSLEQSDLQQLPSLVGSLREMFIAMEGPHPAVKCKLKCVRALCKTVEVLAAYVDPGQCEQLDASVELCVEALKSMEEKSPMQERIVECVGRVALHRKAWRKALRECKTTCEILQTKVRMAQNDHSLMRYCFWCGAAISGVGFMVREWAANLHSENLVDAAMLTIIDILDDDLEAEWVLQNAERPTQEEVSLILQVIADSMQKYHKIRQMQRHGCRCVALIVSLAPPSQASSVALSMVFQALRRFPGYFGILREALFACRSVWLSAVRCADRTLEEQVLEAYRVESISQLACAIQDKFKNDASQDTEIYEDAAVLVCAIEGVDVAMRRLGALNSTEALTYSIKGVYEFGKVQTDKIQFHKSVIVDTVLKFSCECLNDQRFRQNAELLIGLCW